MELRQLEYFVAVAEAANFTRAAEQVHISQSGVSAQIRQLERELGETLFDRSGRTVGLTTVGSAILPHARAALAAAEGIRIAVDELAGLVRGDVAVGMVSGCALPLLAQLLASFHDRHPAVSVGLDEDGSDRLLERLGRGELDLALVGAAGDETARFEAVTVVDEALVLVVDPRHRFAAEGTVCLRDLRGVALITLPRGTGVRTALDAGCAAAGFEPEISLEASALPMVVHLAGLGLGAAVVPESLARSVDGALHVVAVEDPELRSRLELVWSRSEASSPAARALVEHSRDFMTRWPGSGGVDPV